MRTVGIKFALALSLVVASFAAAANFMAAPQIEIQASEVVAVIEPLQAITATTLKPTASTAISSTTSPAITSPSTSTAPSTVAPPTTAAPTTAPAILGYQERGAAALSRISYPWQEKLPGWTITFKPSKSGVLGYTFTNEQRIEVYVRDGMSEELLAHVIAHEIGHAVDVTLNSGDERRIWLEARGATDIAWWPGEGGISDFRSGAGDFAESFAAWQVGTGSYRSKIGPAPNSDQLDLMATLANG